jgi:hypothetical protein
MLVWEIKYLMYHLVELIFVDRKGGYDLFAGGDVSWALAKMSFAPEDTENTKTDDLDEKQKNVPQDWIVTFQETKKYPVVGVLKK